MELSAIFKGVDQLSNVLENMADGADELASKLSAVEGSSIDDASESVMSLHKAISGSFDSYEEFIAKQEALEASGMTTSEALNQLKNEHQELLTTVNEAIYGNEEAANSLREMASATESASQSQSGLHDALSDGARVYSEFASEIQETEKQIAEMESALVGLVLWYGEGSDEVKEFAETLRGMKDELNEHKKAFNESAESAKEFGTASGESGDKAKLAFEDLGSVIGAVGIAALISEITREVYAMAEAFSEAESIIVKATGATGESLDSLSNSMMNVYSQTASGNMSDVAGAVGEINTRLDLQGKELEHVTGLFLDYSRINNANVTGAVRNVTQVMKNWGVEVSGTEYLMDRLSAAAQMSGASVDSLSSMVVRHKASLQALGYSLDESIGLFAMFEKEGINSTFAVMGLRQAVTRFSKEGRDASVAMQETIEQIANMRTESEATAFATQVFGGRAGPELALAIRTGRFDLESWTAAISESAGTLSTTGEAAMTLETKWLQASNSMSAAFTENLSPAIERVSEFFAGAVQWAGGFLQENEGVVFALTGIATALGVVAGAIMFVNAAFAAKAIVLKVATVAMSAFGVSSMVALWPLYLIAAAIGAVVAIAFKLSKTYDDTNAEVKNLTASSREQYYEIQRLEEQHAALAESMGEESDEALRLRGEIALLTAEYERNKLTKDQLNAMYENTVRSAQDTIEAYDEMRVAQHQEISGVMGLVSIMQDLDAQTELTAAEQHKMIAVVDMLNSSVPGLNLIYDEYTGKLNMTAEAVRGLARAEVERQQNAEKYEYLKNSIADQIALEETIALLEEQARAAEAAMDAIDGGRNSYHGRRERARLRKELDDYNSKLEEQYALYEEVTGIVEELSEEVSSYSEELEEAAREQEILSQKMMQAEDIVNDLIGDIESLRAEYDNAYNSMLSSVQGQFKIWENIGEGSDFAKTRVTMNLDDIKNALTSQAEYWEAYQENIDTVNENLSHIDGFDKFIEANANGSKEAVALMESLAGATEVEAENLIREWERVQEAQGEVSNSYAELVTDFSNRMDELTAKAAESIAELDLSDEAYSGALATMDSYLAGLEEGGSRVSSYITNLGNRVTSALGGKPTNTVNANVQTAMNQAGVGRKASGALSAEPGLTLVGEEGPELVMFGGGERIFTASETRNLLPSEPVSVSAPAGEMPASPVSEKRIVLDIAGSGEIHIDGNINEDAVYEIVAANMKPIILGLLKQEVFEEGNKSYDY